MPTMTSEEMREAYRAKCDYRRRGNIIEERDGDGWKLYFTDKIMNVVKRKSRELQGNVANRLYRQ